MLFIFLVINVLAYCLLFTLLARDNNFCKFNKTILKKKKNRTFFDFILLNINIFRFVEYHSHLLANCAIKEI